MKANFYDLLNDVVEFLDNYADVEDCPSSETGPDVRPNKAMQLMTECEQALREMERLPTILSVTYKE